jgi:hypothetical protein
MSSGRQHPGHSRAVIGALLFGVLLQGTSCPAADVETAMQRARPVVASILNELESPPRSWRVHLQRLRRGTEVSSFDFAGGDQPPTYTCRGWCVLFFLDLDPYAHFAHPTRIAIYDSKPAAGDDGLVVLPPSRWWPTIREPSSPRPVSIFNTVASRADPTHVFRVGGIENELQEPPSLGDLRIALVRGPGDDARLRHPRPTPTPQPPGWSGIAPPCDTGALPVWAVLVNGYHDASDTFDEDVAGMYAVLRGLGVSGERIRTLSPFALPGVPSWMPSSVTALEQAFWEVEVQMAACAGTPGYETPHFVLFWSSHGGPGQLFCNTDVDTQDHVSSGKLGGLLAKLEQAWPGAGPALETTIVIEACESGTVGRFLHAVNPAHRRVFASATAMGVSYRDIDESINGMDDPNPADAGSETIWGYVEAYGSASADADSDGTITFDEAVTYAIDSDVTLAPAALTTGAPGLHEAVVLTPTPAVPMAVHGAWNTSVRVAAGVAFTAPVASAATLAGTAAAGKVVRGETADIDLEIANQGAVAEVGALALRVFRNDRPAPDDWAPVYYPEDDIRTTVMIPGLAPGAAVASHYALEVPCSRRKGETVRLVATLDSGQPAPPTAPTGAAPEQPAVELLLEVEEKFFGLCCWWHELWQ